MSKHYAERDIIGLDRAGNYYCRHVHAMTAEALHDKSDIAAELAWRDQEIDRLREDEDESMHVIDRLSRLLAEIAVIVNGPEPALTRWSYHDLPEKVRALKRPAGHQFLGAGESDCPQEIKAANGELHTLRCKVCGRENPNCPCPSTPTPEGGG
jgi:hypothetical protein